MFYFSPSNIRLSSFQEVQEYLSSDGTCKCGLQCPILVDKVFNFDVCVMSRQWTVDDVNCAEDLTKLCNHKRKIIAMATLQNSQENIPNLGKKLVSDNCTSGTDLTSNCHNSSNIKSKYYCSYCRFSTISISVFTLFNHHFYFLFYLYLLNYVLFNF